MLPSNLVRGNLTRIGTTLIDPNSYATALIAYFAAFYGFYFYVFKSGKFVSLLILLTPVIFLIETSGSRQGILLFVIWLFSLGLKKNWRFTLVSMGLMAGLLLFVFLAFYQQIQAYAVENPNTSVARILFQDQNKMSSLSDLERKESLELGLQYVLNNFVVFGPGSFGHTSSYMKSIDRVAAFPHNGPLFLWTQYGVLTLYFFYMVYMEPVDNFARTE